MCETLPPPSLSFSLKTNHHSLLDISVHALSPSLSLFTKVIDKTQSERCVYVCVYVYICVGVVSALYNVIQQQRKKDRYLLYLYTFISSAARKSYNSFSLFISRSEHFGTSASRR